MPKKQKPSSSPAIHGVLALCGIAMLLLALPLQRGALQPSGSAIHTRVALAADIGIEHASPLTVSVRATDTRSPGLIEFSHAGEEIVKISVPDNWTLREVRNVPLMAVPADAASAGFRRWHVPPKAVVSFQTPGPVRLVIHNPTAVPLHLLHALVSLDEKTVEEDSTLITDKEATIW